MESSGETLARSALVRTTKVFALGTEVVLQVRQHDAEETVVIQKLK